MARDIQVVTVMVLGLLTVGTAAHAQTVIRRDGWNFDRADVDDLAPQPYVAAIPTGSSGWAEYDVVIDAAGWFSLWQQHMPPTWPRELYVDGERLWPLYVTVVSDDQDGVWLKEGNLFLAAGAHTLRFQRLAFPMYLPSVWELRPAQDDAASSLNAKLTQAVVRAGDAIEVTVSAGRVVATSYELLVRNQESGEVQSVVASLSFAATAAPASQTVSFAIPTEGVYTLLAAYDGALLRPADLGAGHLVVVGTAPPAAAPTLERTLMVDIDCTAQSPSLGYWEKDGPTRIVAAPFGMYRESSGTGPDFYWGLDGFSYAFALPDHDHVYQLEVDYPDDARRTMGFWVRDGTTTDSFGHQGDIMTGGVDTGDRYRVTGRMQTYRSLFYPRAHDNMLVAVVSLSPGFSAAAARIRVYRLDSGLPVGPGRRAGGRRLAYFFEEPLRWNKQFGTDRWEDFAQHLRALNRWAELTRAMGGSVLSPTIAGYQEIAFPSDALPGYFRVPYDLNRLAALVAEKYSLEYLPEVLLSGQAWFDKHTMGVWKDPADGEVRFASPQAEARVVFDSHGGVALGSTAFNYNALHPDVQSRYLSFLDEVMAGAADTRSLIGVSSRLMIDWAFQGWNATPYAHFLSPELSVDYGDWTIAEHGADTGIDVPGAAGDPDRFQARYDFLTAAPQRDAWLAWRDGRIFDYHRRMREHLQAYKPDAQLLLPYHATMATPHPGYHENERERLRAIGVDLDMYAGEPNISLPPQAFYGRRRLGGTPVERMDAMMVEPLVSDAFASLAQTGVRATMLWSSYFEVGGRLDWTELGGATAGLGAFDACTPTGVYERELYAAALATSDASLIINGGNGWIFGSTEALHPFLDEFNALPARPFEPLAMARDPLAVWTRHDSETFYFYAVNRLPYSVVASIALANADTLVSTRTGESALRREDGSLKLCIRPFMVRGFAATGDGASIASVTTRLPPAELDRMTRLIAASDALREAIADGTVTLGPTERTDALAALDDAHTAYESGSYARARDVLSRRGLIAAYSQTGGPLPGLFNEPLEIYGGVVTLVSAAYGVPEQDGFVEVQVERDDGCDGAVTVGYATADDTAQAALDYESTTGTVSWDDGEIGVKIIRIPILTDRRQEASETLTLSLQLASGATLGSITRATIRIDNADVQPMRVVARGCACDDSAGSLWVGVLWLGLLLRLQPARRVCFRLQPQVPRPVEQILP